MVTVTGRGDNPRYMNDLFNVTLTFKRLFGHAKLWKCRKSSRMATEELQKCREKNQKRAEAEGGRKK